MAQDRPSREKPALVDSTVILDVATDDPRWGRWSAMVLEREADRGVLVINPIIYAEVSVGYPRIEDLEAALPASVYRREPLPYDAAFLAGKAFLHEGRGLPRYPTSTSERTLRWPATAC
jgi:hypothetical protein